MKAIKWIVLGFIFLGIVYCSVHCLQQKAILERTKVTQDVLDLFATKKTLETATVKISRTFSGEQDISQLIPGVGIDDITHSPLFRYTMTLPVEAVVRAGFRLDTLGTGNIHTDKQNYVELVLPLPEVLGIQLQNFPSSQTTSTGTSEQDTYMQIALKAKAKEFLLQEAVQSGLIDTAESNAQEAFEALFSGTDIHLKNITILAK